MSFHISREKSASLYNNPRPRIFQATSWLCSSPRKKKSTWQNSQIKQTFRRTTLTCRRSYQVTPQKVWENSVSWSEKKNIQAFVSHHGAVEKWFWVRLFIMYSNSGKNAFYGKSHPFISDPMMKDNRVNAVTVFYYENDISTTIPCIKYFSIMTQVLLVED